MVCVQMRRFIREEARCSVRWPTWGLRGSSVAGLAGVFNNGERKGLDSSRSDNGLGSLRWSAKSPQHVPRWNVPGCTTTISGRPGTAAGSAELVKLPIGGVCRDSHRRSTVRDTVQ